MNIPSDPYMLLSFVNMKLRDEYPSFSELCRSLDLEKEALEEKLKAVGYEYDPSSNQFKTPINKKC